MATACTSFEFTSAVLSQIHGTAGACSAIMWLILAQASLRALPTGITDAFFIASLIAGSFSCGQLTLPCCRMFLPLNVASSIDCGSAKSLNQPTFGQIATLAFGTPQNFVYSVSWGTIRKFSLKPSFANCAWATSAVFL